MLSKSAPHTQLQTILTLLLNNRTEHEIVRVTGYSVSVVRQLIEANKSRITQHLAQYQTHKQRQQSHQRHIDQCEKMIDTIREVGLGLVPLYREVDLSNTMMYCSNHTRRTIEAKRRKSIRKTPKPKSILEHMIDYHLHYGE